MQNKSINVNPFLPNECDFRHSDVVAGERFSGCGMNKDSTESGEKMHEIVEGYAADNNNFIQVWPKTQSFLCLLLSFFSIKYF